MRKLFIFLVLLCVVVVPIAAQDEAEADLPEIEVFRSSAGFNVPVVELDGWENQSEGDTALFVNAALDATINVVSVNTLDDDEAITTALSALVADDLPAEPFYTGRVGLLNGTWTQTIYQLEETTISSLALVRSRSTFVVTLVETSPDYDAYQLIIRTPQAENDAGDLVADFEAGVAQAAATLTLFDGEPDDITAPDLPGGEWLTFQYADGAIVGFEFEDTTYTYTMQVTGDTSGAEAIAQAFDIVFLGFFITPNNDEYLYLGLAVTFAIFALLIGSFVWRYRNAQKDLQLVEQLADE